MQLNISFKHMEPSQELRTFIHEKCQSLQKYFKGKINVSFNLAVERQNHIAHCHVFGNSIDFFGEGTTEDFKASIDIALEKIEKQVRKHKEIVKNHLHRHSD